MITKKEAQEAVEVELRSLKLTKQMTPAEMIQFCQKMYSRLQFRTKGDRFSVIRNWAEAWQKCWLPSN